MLDTPYPNHLAERRESTARDTRIDSLFFFISGHKGSLSWTFQGSAFIFLNIHGRTNSTCKCNTAPPEPARMRPMSRNPYQHLTATERAMICLLDEENHSVREIARRVGRSPATISLERHRGRDYRQRYCPSTGVLVYRQRRLRSRRSSPSKATLQHPRSTCLGDLPGRRPTAKTDWWVCQGSTPGRNRLSLPSKTAPKAGFKGGCKPTEGMALQRRRKAHEDDSTPTHHRS